MPAKRLPWYKVWAEHLDHPKVCELTDGEYRTWHYLLAKASQQPVRWYFASTAHAAKVTGRPLAQIKKLLAYGLLEEGATALSQGIWIHNAPKWQNKYPSDYSGNAPGTLLEFCQNVAVNAAATPISDTETDTEGDTDTEHPQPIRLRDGDAPEGATHKRASRIPENYVMDPEVFDWALKLDPPLNEAETLREAEKWHDHHTAKGTTARDWPASLRHWMRNASDIKAGRSPFGSRTRRGGNGGATRATFPSSVA